MGHHLESSTSGNLPSRENTSNDCTRRMHPHLLIIVSNGNNNDVGRSGMDKK
jgi:hypothetical protein